MLKMNCIPVIITGKKIQMSQVIYEKCLPGIYHRNIMHAHK